MLRSGLSLRRRMMPDQLYIKMTITVPIEESDAADTEIEELHDYITSRLEDGADIHRVVQSLTEALAVICIGDDMESETLH